MEAPFTEKRDWNECPHCLAMESKRFGAIVQTLEDCPECGQPSRCTWWHESGEGRCERVANMDPFKSNMGTCCGQHYVNSDVSFQIEEAQYAQKWIRTFLDQAKLTGNPFLEASFDMAWAHSEMLLNEQVRVQDAIWSDG